MATKKKVETQTDETPTKAAVKFKQPWQRYYPSDTAAFSVDIAKELVDSGIAELSDSQSQESNPEPDTDEE